MKKCNDCKEEKDVSEFNKHAGRKDGLQSFCRRCNRERSRVYYKRNGEKHKKKVLEYKKKYTQKNREWVYEYLLTHPCVDCGEKDPVVLDFDHLADKELEICNMMQRDYSLTRIKQEVEKCVTRCANCHRKKTAKEFNWWKYRMDPKL